MDIINKIYFFIISLQKYKKNPKPPNKTYNPPYIKHLQKPFTGPNTHFQLLIILYCCSDAGSHTSSVLILELIYILVRITTIFFFPREKKNSTTRGKWNRNGNHNLEQLLYENTSQPASHLTRHTTTTAFHPCPQIDQVDSRRNEFNGKQAQIGYR